jgi:hypothetical protein
MLNVIMLRVVAPSRLEPTQALSYYGLHALHIKMELIDNKKSGKAKILTIIEPREKNQHTFENLKILEKFIQIFGKHTSNETWDEKAERE